VLNADTGVTDGDALREKYYLAHVLYSWSIKRLGVSYTVSRSLYYSTVLSAKKNSTYV
jgi:hypothetical protein